MNTNTEDAVKDTVENHSDKKESSEQEIDESVLDGYTTEDGRVAPEIVEGLHSNERNARLEAAKKLRQLAERREATGVQKIIDSGLSRAIVENVLSGDVELQDQILGLVIAITIGTSEQASALVAEGVIPKLVELASLHTSDGLREDALLALGNIGADSQPSREKVIQEGGLKLPLEILASPSEYPQDTVKCAVHAIHGYTHPIEGKVPGYEVTKEIIPILCKYIAGQDAETGLALQTSLCSLQHVLEDDPQVDDALKIDFVPQLVRLCASKETKTRHNALSCVSQIIRDSVPGTDALINAGILDKFKVCIASEEVRNRKVACFAASNLAVGTVGHGKAFMDSGLLSLFIEIILNQEETVGVRGDAAWTLSGLAYSWGGGHHDVLDTLLEADVLEALCTALTLTDYNAVEASLKGIFVFVKTQWDGQQRAIERVKAGDGIERLCALRFRNDIYRTEAHKLAQTILTNHFPEFSTPARM